MNEIRNLKKLKKYNMKTYFSLWRNIVILFFITLLSSQFHAQIKKTAEVEGITEYMLDNGLKVLLFPDNSSQTATVNILI